MQRQHKLKQQSCGTYLKPRVDILRVWTVVQFCQIITRMEFEMNNSQKDRNYMCVGRIVRNAKSNNSADMQLRRETHLAPRHSAPCPAQQKKTNAISDLNTWAQIKDTPLTRRGHAYAARTQSAASTITRQALCAHRSRVRSTAQNK